MARSWKSVDGRPLGDFAQNNTLDDPRSGFRYRLLLDEGRVVQEETLLDRKLADNYRQRREARYAAGSGEHAQALVSETNGYLHLLPVAWFAAEQRWRLNPGYELQNHRFDRPIAPGCIACHGTVATYRSPTRNRYEQPIPDGISCQRCHGPGAAHVAFWRDRGDRKTASLVDPARLPADRANDVCLQCHLQGDVMVFQPGRDEFSFRPGERLSDHRLDFLIQTDRAEAFGVASHGARMLRSRCHLDGERTLTCIQCHDPHVSIGEVPRTFFDARCIECHAPQTCSRATAPEEKEVAAGCIRCHMPQRTTREGQHLVFTDHWIRRRPAGQELEHSVLPPNADVELIPLWPDADRDQVRLGSAYVLLHESMGPQLPSLNRGVSLLSRALEQGQADADARYWLASGWISQRQSTRAAGLLRDLLREQPNRWPAHFRLGIALDQLRDYDAAIGQYERVVQAVPDWMDPYPLLARLYLFKQQPAKAVDLLQKQVEFKSDVMAFTSLAAAKAMRGDAPEGCLKLIDAALQLDPRHVPSLLARGQIRFQMGDKRGAAESFGTALEVDPANEAARAALQQVR